MSCPPAPPRLTALLALVAATALSVPALAQTNDELTAARQVFGEGKALEGKDRWAEALEKFKKVATVKMTPQVRFHIALCEEHLGKLVSAIRGFELAGEEAKQAGSSAAEVEKLAPERSAALRERVAKLKIEVTGKVIDSKILLDDQPLLAKDLGVDMPADPGAHVVEVKDKDGKSTFRKELTLAEKGAESVALSIDDKEPPALPPVDQPPPPPPSRAPVYVAGGLGVASFAVSGVLWVLRGNTINQLQQSCSVDSAGAMRCPNSTANHDLENKGRAYGLVSGIFLGVGVVGAVTATGFLVVPLLRKPAAQPAPQAAPAQSALRLVPTGNGVHLVGEF
jgi:hypothetical protein